MPRTALNRQIVLQAAAGSDVGSAGADMQGTRDRLWYYTRAECSRLHE